MGYKLGMPTLIELNNIDDTVKLCQRLGLSFVELNMNMPPFNPQNLKPAELKKVTDQTGIEFTMHLPDELDLASFNLPIRKGNINCCKEAIGWAAKAGVRLINMHLSKGPYFTLPDRKVYMYEQYQREYLNDIEEAFRDFVGLANNLNIQICIENVGNFHLPYIKEAICHLMSQDEIGLTWDVGHDAKSGYKEKDILLKYKNKIRHMHLHDYDGNSDHKPLFSGNVDIKSMIQFAKCKDISVLIEVKTEEALSESVKLLNYYKE